MKSIGNKRFAFYALHFAFAVFAAAAHAALPGAYALRFADSLTGRIDEFRIHDGVQSAAYVSADYATQTDPDFLTFGEIQSHGGFFIILR